MSEADTSCFSIGQAEEIVSIMANAFTQKGFYECVVYSLPMTPKAARRLHELLEEITK